MPMPHRTFAQVARRRLQGKEGAERIRTINELSAELPDYRNGPYADLRKWLDGELERTRVRAKVVHRDSLQVRREGAAQVALVGAPNAGKSSLLQALSDIQIKTGDYAFTTLRPVPALTRIGGVLVQLVEIPGLIEGAHEDRGGGRALLGVLRNADAIVWCQAMTADRRRARTSCGREVAAAGIEKPGIVAATKSDERGRGRRRSGSRPRRRRSRSCPSRCSTTRASSGCASAIWALTGLIRVHLRRDGDDGRRAARARAGARPSRTSRTRSTTSSGASCAGASRLGPVGAVRRSAGRPRARRRRRRHGRGADAVSGVGSPGWPSRGSATRRRPPAAKAQWRRSRGIPVGAAWFCGCFGSRPGATIGS